MLAGLAAGSVDFWRVELLVVSSAARMPGWMAAVLALATAVLVSGSVDGARHLHHFSRT